MVAGSGWKLVALLAVAGMAALFGSVLGRASWPRADLVIGNGPDPRSLDPTQTSAIADGRILASLFEGLVGLDPADSAPEPAMAESWERSEDGLRWTFRLRPGLRWSDGVPLTAPDLRWSFLRVLDPVTAARSPDLLDAVDGARAFRQGKGPRSAVGIAAPDDRSLAFTLAGPAPCFLETLALFPLYPTPRHVVEREGRRWTRPESFAGNGPFRLVGWRLRDRVRVERNPHWRDAGGVALGTIDWLCVEAATTRLNLYLTGGADVITDVPPGAVPELLARFGPESGGEFRPAPRLATFFYRVNTTAGPFRNPRIRRALGRVVDRDAVALEILRAGEIPARSLVPPGVRAGGADYERPLLPPPDLAAARAELAEGLGEEGLASLPPFEVLYSPEVGDQSVAEYLQHAWRPLGISCRLVNLDSQSLLDRLRRLDYAVARSSWIGDFLDPSTFLDQFTTGSAGNRTGWSHPDYDRLVREEAPRALGAERARLLRAAEGILLDAAPILPVYHNASRAMVKPYVRGWHRNLLDWHPPARLAVEPRP